MAVKILHNDDNFIIVNKPYDMYINSDNINEKNTVACHIASQDSHLSSSSQPLHFVQRLDYATSGVLCIAKNKRAAAKAGRLLEKRFAKKYYLAVLRGHVKFASCSIEYEIGDDPSTQDTNHKMLAVTDPTSQSASRRSRSARTTLLVLETGFYEGDPATVVVMKPTTGRRHQLRVHCSTIGHTILGDYTYSDGKDDSTDRMFLHAMRLVLPFQDKTLDIQTAEPFYSDDIFKNKWKTETVFHEFRESAEFISTCAVIDLLSEDSDILVFKYTSKPS